MDENEKLVLESIKKYKSMGYNNDQIKVAMQKSGIPEQETIKLINFKPFYLRAWFFVPVILALIFVGLLGAFVLDEFVFISEPVNEIDLIEDGVIDDSSSTGTTADEVVDDDETEDSCGDGVCDSSEDCALDCGCETAVDNVWVHPLISVTVIDWLPAHNKLDTEEVEPFDQLYE